MNDGLKGEEKVYKGLETGDCCGAASGLGTGQALPVLNLSGGYCCAGSSNEVTPAAPCVTKRSKPLWVWGAVGLVGLAILVLGSGIFPGLRPSVFWHHVLLNLAFVGKNAWSILPYFILSVVLSAWVTVSGFAERIKGVFDRREKIAIAGAAIVGASVPLCSCGVIPFIAAMLAKWSASWAGYGLLD